MTALKISGAAALRVSAMVLLPAVATAFLFPSAMSDPFMHRPAFGGFGGMHSRMPLPASASVHEAGDAFHVVVDGHGRRLAPFHLSLTRHGTLVVQGG